MMKQTPLLLALLGASILTACGGGGSGGNPNPGGGNAIRDRLVACPLVMQSSDPAASACLAGTYTGKTLSNETCSLVVEASGNYQFTSAALSYAYSATTKSIRVFGHQNVGGLHQVIWLISDPIQAADSFDLNFHYADGLGKKLEIEATKRPASGGSVSSTCTAVLS